MASLSGLTSRIREVMEAPFNPDAPDALPNPLEAVTAIFPDPESREYSWIESLPPNPRDVAKRQSAENATIRRPTVGLVGYEDRFATLEVIARGGGGDGSEDVVQLLNSTYRSGRANQTSNFIVQNIQEQDQDTIRPQQTLGDWYVSDSSESPRFFTVSGVLFEARNFPWLTEFRANYDRYLRGRQCLIRRAQVYLTIDDTMYIGYIMNSSLNRTVIPSFVTVAFQFSMMLREVVDLRAVQLFPEGPLLDSTDTAEVRTTELTSRANSRLIRDEARWDSSAEFALTDLEDELLRETESLGNSLFALNDGDNLSTRPQEVVKGLLEGRVVDFESTPLEWTGTLDEAALRIDVETLVAVARRINAATGRQVFDLQNLRNGYLAGRRADYELMGETNPDVLQKFGFPSRYQTAADAQTRAVQEEYRDAMETAVDWARDRISGISWL